MQKEFAKAREELERAKKQMATSKEENALVVTQYKAQMQQLFEQLASSDEKAKADTKAKDAKLAEMKKALDECMARAKAGGKAPIPAAGGAEIQKLRKQLEEAKKDYDQLSQQFDQAQDDQKLMNTQYKKMIEDETERCTKLEGAMKMKDGEIAALRAAAETE